MAASANLQKFCCFNSGWLASLSEDAHVVVRGWLVAPSGQLSAQHRDLNGQICFRRGSACSKCCRDGRPATLQKNQSQPAHSVLQSGKWSRGKFYKCLISIMYFGHCCYHPGIHNCCRNVFKSIMIIVAAPWPPAHLGWEIEKNNFWPQIRIWPDCWDYKRTETCCYTDIGPRDRVMPGIVSQMSAWVSWHRDTWSQPMTGWPLPHTQG